VWVLGDIVEKIWDLAVSGPGRLLFSLSETNLRRMVKRPWWCP
jgi:hypothetical protein